MKIEVEKRAKVPVRVIFQGLISGTSHGPQSQTNAKQILHDPRILGTLVRQESIPVRCAPQMRAMRAQNAKGARSVEKEMRTDGKGACTGGCCGRSAGKGTPQVQSAQCQPEKICAHVKRRYWLARKLCARSPKETRTAGIGARIYRKYTGAEGETPHSEVPALLPELVYLKKRPPWWL
jgi:hypothetical protein